MKKSKSASPKKVAAAPAGNPLLTLLIIAGLATLVVSYSYFNMGPKSSPQVAQKADINEVVPSVQGFASLRLAPTGVTGTFAKPYVLNLQYQTSMDLVINGGVNELTGATVELIYDPTKLEIVSVTKGAFFPFVLKEATINKTTKRVTFDYGISPDVIATTGGKTGEGVLATLVVKPLVAGPSTLSFASLEGITAPTTAQKTANTANTTKIIAKGYTTNVLTSAPDFTFTTPAKLSADFVDTGDAQTIDAATGVQISDDQVNIFDFNFFVSAYGKTTAAALVADIALPKNSKVDILDYAEFIRQWGL